MDFRSRSEKAMEERKQKELEVIARSRVMIQNTKKIKEQEELVKSIQAELNSLKEKTEGNAEKTRVLDVVSKSIADRVNIVSENTNEELSELTTHIKSLQGILATLNKKSQNGFISKKQTNENKLADIIKLLEKF